MQKSIERERSGFAPNLTVLRGDGGTDSAESSHATRRTLSVDLSLTRSALGLAVGSLLLAGCFSLLLIAGRMPVFSEWISDPGFFKRCLVLHVDLALIVWFFSFAAALFSLLPGNRASHGCFRVGLFISAGGVVAMIGGTIIPGSTPVLANYVPVIDTALYVAGVALFLGGLTGCFVNDRLFVNRRESADDEAACWIPFQVTPDVAVALKSMALAYVVAITTFLISWAATPRNLEAGGYYELVFWGGGHVLQVANVAAMLSVWLLLLSSWMKSAVLSKRSAQILFALLIAPHLAAPLLVMRGTVDPLYRIGFTRLMQFGIAPIVLTILAICIRKIMRAKNEKMIARDDFRDLRFVGFAASAALTLAGFLMGAAIRNSNTMIPAHYHASIGAVTVAFMSITYLLLKPIGFPLPNERFQRLIPWQLALFGGGQIIFAIGFGLGGMNGLGRKAYGAEQTVRSAGELLGLGIMGAGGLIAVAGGLLFLFLTVCAGQRCISQSIFRIKVQSFARNHS